MLEEIMRICTSLQEWNWTLAVLIAILLPFAYTYLKTSWDAARTYAAAQRQPSGHKRAPTLPYAVPVLAHLFSFIADGSQFLSKAANYYGPGTPIKVKFVPGLSRYIITGPEMVVALFRETRALSGVIDELTMLENGLGSPRQSVAFYDADNSGAAPTPAPGSTVDPGNRIFHTMHKLLNSYLSGPSLTGITARFQEKLANLIEEDDLIGDTWVEIPDLYEYVQNLVMSAAVHSMFGAHILSLNPTLVKDFFAYNGKVDRLFMSIPRWIDPEAYKLREKMLTAIKRWHNHAHDHYDCNRFGEEDPEWEPYFGSKFSRARQSQFLQWEQLDETARAADDLGIIWASNANSVPAAGWFLYEILRDPTLELNIRAEFASAALHRTSLAAVPLFDITKLCSGPRLQSIYAETLRLRVAILVSRRVQIPQFQFRGWLFKENESIAVVSSTEAHDEAVWSQGGEANPHPLNEFWAERFLVFPENPASGPLKRPKAPRSIPTNTDSQNQSSEPIFSMDGLATSWIPYSGGPRLCPGRHFAKQEMIAASAVLLSAYDMELTEPGKRIAVNKSYYGFGTMPPKDKIGVRIRRRARGSRLS